MAARAHIPALLAALLLLAACAGAPKPAQAKVAPPLPVPGRETPDLPEGRRQAAPPAEPRAPSSAEQANARVIFEEGVRQSQGSLDAAAATFERAFAMDPGLGFAAYNAGVIYERMGDVIRARDAYVRALKVTADFEPASQNLTRLRLRSGRAEEAEADLRARIAGYPEKAGLRNQLVEVLIATGRLDSAEQEARKILKTDEHNIPAMVNLAMAYYAKKRHELAKMVLENARQVDPGEAVVWNKLGFVELALGNRPQAFEDFKKAAALRPDYPEAQINYGAMLVEAEDFAGAVKVLELAIQYAPNNAQAHLDLGNAYRGNRQFEQAQREYERAQLLDPKLVDAQYNLGILHMDGEKPGLPVAERLEKAIAYLDKYAAAGGSDPRLALYRRDAQAALEKEKKRLAREAKDEVRKAAEARKKEEERLAAEAAAAQKAEKEGVAVPPAAPPAPSGKKLGGEGEDK
jgi:tetratricopeptide (TPR) repeat protein